MYDLRLACIDGKFVAATWRVPTRVYGDGENTIRQLIEQENKSPNRGVAYYAPLATIDVSQAASFLGDTIETVPARGKEVQVIGVANYGAGGEIIDATADIPQWMAEEAVRISTASGLVVCGVDYIVSVQPTAASTVLDLDAYVIEVNKCPSLAIHDNPTSGKPRGAVAAYVEYLATIPPATSL